MSAAARPFPPVLAVLLAAGVLLCCLLSWPLIAPALNAGTDGGYDAARMVALYATLPRLVTALVAGAALSLSGALFQQVLRNPLASPTTLGISAGANLALVIAMLLFPALLGFGRDLVALTGSGAAAAIVVGLSMRRGLSPLAVILAGLVIGLWFGALAAVLVFVNDRHLVSLFIWGAGSLAQQSWDIPLALLWKTALLALACAALIRPLALLELGDDAAAALGIGILRLRLVTIAIATALAALVTSSLGVIGFIGLLAPAIARAGGARGLKGQLCWSAALGALLLLTVDLALQHIGGALGDFLPTGAVTAVFGTPLLLLLLPRLRIRHRVIADPRQLPHRRLSGRAAATGIGTCLAALLVFAAFAGRGFDGTWQWASMDDLGYLTSLRLPRVSTAFAAGAMLGAAGVILQRLTGNEMASPEVLGISAGASMGLAVSLFVAASAGMMLQSVFAAAGAFTVLAAILALGMRSGLAPERVLLAGIALAALVDALAGVLASGGDPRALQLLRWMGGSTQQAVFETALALSAVAALLIASALAARRWLDLMPLGPVAVRALGMPLKGARLLLFALAGLLSAAATLGVGPLSFVGLIAPHLAREAGLTRALPQIAGAAAAGGAIMVTADWLGRMAAFPYQLPAGLMAALVGAPFLLILLSRRRSS